MKKTFKSYLIIWALLLVVFNAVAFLFGGVEETEKYTSSFWIGYGFIMLSFAGQLLCAYKAFNAKNLQKMFYNLPLITVSWTGLIVSFVAGGFCMLISALPYWVGAIIAVVSLAFCAMAVVKASIAVEAVAAVGQKIKVQTFFVKSLTVDADTLMAQAKTEDAKAACKKVYEAIRYSDPMSNDALASVEGQITVKFAAFADAVKADDADKIASLGEEVVILVGDRNKKCKLLK